MAMHCHHQIVGFSMKAFYEIFALGSVSASAPASASSSSSLVYSKPKRFSINVRRSENNVSTVRLLNVNDCLRGVQNERGIFRVKFCIQRFCNGGLYGFSPMQTGWHTGKEANKPYETQADLRIANISGGHAERG